MTYTQPIEDVVPGQTILCNGTPSLVLLNTGTPKGRILTFFSPNAENVIAMFDIHGAPVTVAPLAPTA
jgi:hypothetical protein